MSQMLTMIIKLLMVTAVDSEKNYYILDYYHEHLTFLYEMPKKYF